MILVWSEPAIRTLEDQLEHIRQDKPSAAEHMASKIDSRTQLLVHFPEIGRHGRRSGTRELVISGTPYIAVYRIRTNQIEILRLLHGAQHWP